MIRCFVTIDENAKTRRTRGKSSVDRFKRVFSSTDNDSVRPRCEKNNFTVGPTVRRPLTVLGQIASRERTWSRNVLSAFCDVSPSAPCSGERNENKTTGLGHNWDDRDDRVRTFGRGKVNARCNDIAILTYYTVNGGRAWFSHRVLDDIWLTGIVNELDHETRAVR